LVIYTQRASTAPSISREEVNLPTLYDNERESVEHIDSCTLFGITKKLKKHIHCDCIDRHFEKSHLHPCSNCYSLWTIISYPSSMHTKINPDRYLPIKTMSAEEESRLQHRKKMIQQTWRAVEFGLDVDCTRIFYTELFRKYPSVQPMFQHSNMEVQAQKLYEVIRVAVRFLDNVQELIPVLQDLGMRHAKHYGVLREHYDAVTEVFISVLNNYILAELDCGNAGIWAMEVADAWHWVLTFIGNTMADAGDQAMVKDVTPNSLANVPTASVVSARKGEDAPVENVV
jgi:hemoglobin-like flavoprotein